MGRTILLHFSKEVLAIFPEILGSWKKPTSELTGENAPTATAKLLKSVEEKSKRVEEILLHAQ